MPAHQEFQSAENICIRYEKKNDGDGDMLYLENALTGETFVLCGSNVEIFRLLENAISRVRLGEGEELPSTFFYLADENTFEVKITDEGIIIDAYAQSGQQHVGSEARLASEWWDAITTGLRQCDDCGYMEDAGGSPDWANGKCKNCDPSLVDTEADVNHPVNGIRAMIKVAHNKGLLRYAPKHLEFSDDQRYYSFDLVRTFGSGVEFEYDHFHDTVINAVQTIDGEEIPVDEFIDEMRNLVYREEIPVDEFLYREEQPCQHYAKTRAIVDEELEVTKHNDEEERTWLVTQITAVKATGEQQAIDRVNEMHGSCDLVAQDAESRLEKFRVGAVHEVWAENGNHAVEQFYDIINDEDGQIVNLIEEVDS